MEQKAVNFKEKFMSVFGRGFRSTMLRSIYQATVSIHQATVVMQFSRQGLNHIYIYCTHKAKYLNMCCGKGTL